MLNFTIDLGKLTDWLNVLVAALAFSSGLFVLWMNKRNIDALISQIRSQSVHQTFEAHKTLYMPIVQSEELSNLVSGGHGVTYREQLLGSMLINHANRLFSEVRAGNLPELEEENFRTDLSDFLTWPIVRKRWPEVKAFHRADFVAFVDDCLAASAKSLPPPDATLAVVPVPTTTIPSAGEKPNTGGNLRTRRKKAVANK